MKKPLCLQLSLLFIAVLSFQFSEASIEKPLPLLATGLSQMPLKDLLNLSSKQITERTGIRLTGKQKIALTLMRPSMKKAVRKNPAIAAGEYFSSSKRMKGWLKVVLIIAGILLIAFIIFALAYSGKI